MALPLELHGARGAESSPSGRGILAWIPARGGSKGVPHKHLQGLGSLPLIGWTIRAALASSLAERVVVDTDDTEIARMARAFGAEVPCLRPPELSGDRSDLGKAAYRMMDFLAERGFRTRVLVNLSPTNPFRRPGLVDEVIHRLLIDPDADWVLSYAPGRSEPREACTLAPDGSLRPFLPRRAESAGRPLRISMNVNASRIWPAPVGPVRIRSVLLDPVEGVDIDEPADLDLARALVDQGVAAGYHGIGVSAALEAVRC